MSVNRLEFDRLETPWAESGYDLSGEPRKNLRLEATSIPSWVDQIEQFLADHPKTMVVAALALGVAFGWLGKRK